MCCGGGMGLKCWGGGCRGGAPVNDIVPVARVIPTQIPDCSPMDDRRGIVERHSGHKFGVRLKKTNPLWAVTGRERN